MRIPLRPDSYMTINMPDSECLLVRAFFWLAPHSFRLTYHQGQHILRSLENVVCVMSRNPDRSNE
jgi:hypothetical protein